MTAFLQYCLRTLFMPQDYSGVKISQAVQSILVSFITTDNGSNVIVALEILKRNSLTCFGHNLHSAITNSLEDDDWITHVAHK